MTTLDGLADAIAQTLGHGVDLLVRELAIVILVKPAQHVLEPIGDRDRPGGELCSEGGRQTRSGSLAARGTADEGRARRLPRIAMILRRSARLSVTTWTPSRHISSVVCSPQRTRFGGLLGFLGLSAELS